MIRRTHVPRLDWRDAVSEQGLIWHTIKGEPYWAEGTYYEFTMAEIEKIEAATASLYDVFLEAGEYIVGHEHVMSQIGIPVSAHAAIRAAWEAEPPCLNYGRFDFGFDGTGVPKLFEFNCDTPTSLLEASVVQWTWKEDVFPDLDQFNSIHETLVAKWRDIAPLLTPGPVHFTHSCDEAGEDMVTVAYLRDTAEEAGIETKVLLIDDIGVDVLGRFLDQNDEVISSIFKLYPWEWMVNEQFGSRALNQHTTLWMEPVWKMLWSNKGILPILKKVAPDNPYLLDASFQRPAGGRYVAKPFLSREGANITLVDEKHPTAETDGPYGEEGYVYQEVYDLPQTAPGVYPVIGSWIVDGTPCGMGIREDGLITGNAARFVPHVIKG